MSLLSILKGNRKTKIHHNLCELVAAQAVTLQLSFLVLLDADGEGREAY
jgi:hypothetical protein